MAKRKTLKNFIEELSTINSNIEVLGNYINAKTKIECRCKIHNNIFYPTSDHLLQGRVGCPICAKEHRDQSHKPKTHEQFIKDVSEKNPNIKIIGKYNGALNSIRCKCRICDNEFDQFARKVIEGVGCPICANVRIIKGINDIATTNPELLKYFKNSEDAYKYHKGSKAKVIFKCPDCGFEKEISIMQVSKLGIFSCPKCSDGISYPNKFSRNLLQQLPVKNVKYEYSPDWAKPYRYDNYFEFNNNKYILEMDGGFHYIKYYKSNLSLEETKHIDKFKDKLAKDHNITMIRINCFYSEKNYIINNIKNSLLSNLFDLSKINWELCHINSIKNLVKEVCNFYNSHKNYKVKQIANEFNLKAPTVSKYLYIGNDIGLCKYHPSNKIKVHIVVNSLELSFNTINDCIRYFSKSNSNLPLSQLKNAIHKRETCFKGITISYPEF